MTSQVQSRLPIHRGVPRHECALVRRSLPSIIVVGMYCISSSSSGWTCVHDSTGRVPPTLVVRTVGIPGAMDTKRAAREKKFAATSSSQRSAVAQHLEPQPQACLWPTDNGLRVDGQARGGGNERGRRSRCLSVIRLPHSPLRSHLLSPLASLTPQSLSCAGVLSGSGTSSAPRSREPAYHCTRRPNARSDAPRAAHARHNLTSSARLLPTLYATP